MRALGADNAGCDRRDLVTIDSVRNHCELHFPVQQVARGYDRDIVERRPEENQIDFVKGVATALLPVTFVEVTTEKAFEALVNDRTEVSIETGLRAAEKLQAVLGGHAWVVQASILPPRLTLRRHPGFSRFPNRRGFPLLERWQ